MFSEREKPQKDSREVKMKRKGLEGSLRETEIDTTFRYIVMACIILQFLITHART